MKATELRKKFIEFFLTKRHKKIPPSSLVPKDDPTTLFTGSGMQQLVPYLKGEPHPMGKRLVDCQPCFRAEDIEEVGDNRHTTFFEMLGNWSLGDYFKKEQLPWFFTFLTEIAGLDPQKLYVTIFTGSQSVPRDEESIKIWQELFKTKKPAKAGREGFDPKSKIYTYGGDKNWWSRVGIPEKMPVGEIGGPDSEVFYDFGAELKLHEKSPYKEEKCHLNCQCGRFLEIGNSVFMEYEKQTGDSFKPLPAKNVDFGGGLERITAASQNQLDIFQTDLFIPIISEIEKASNKKYKGDFKASIRVVADHLKAAVFMAQEDLEPSNKKQGYVMRRLIRRSVVKMMQLNIPVQKFIPNICQKTIETYGDLYFSKKPYEIKIILGKEIDSFQQTIHRGTKLLQTKKISGKLLFDLYQSYGFPFEISKELLKEWGMPITEKEEKEFYEEKKKHQELSRTASKDMFKGGLADHSEQTTKLHTATHLLHSSLRKILGNQVHQVGSNITAERLRFDFIYPDKLTQQQIKQIEDLVNQQIKKNLRVECQVMPLEEAKKAGALAFFGQKYPEQVKVYRIQAFSLEVCGGPHVDFTGTLETFKIVKEETVGTGKRRLYATIG